MIVTMTDTAVVAFSPERGTVLWQHPYENARQNHPITPIYHDGWLYITSGYGKGAIGLRIAEDGKSVTQVWEQPRQDPVHGQAVLVDGYVYAASHQKASGRWSCVDLRTGKLAWEATGVGKGGSVTFADGLLYCYSEDGTVGLMRPSPAKCEVVSSFKVTQGNGHHWAHLVVAKGRLFVRHGTALCVRPEAQVNAGCRSAAGQGESVRPPTCWDLNLKNSSASKSVTRAQKRGREIRVIDGIRKVLRFEAKGGVVEMVGGEELHAWLGRAHFQAASAGGVLNARGELERGAPAIEHEIVIVTAGTRLELVDSRRRCGWVW